MNILRALPFLVVLASTSAFAAPACSTALSVDGQALPQARWSKAPSPACVEKAAALLAEERARSEGFEGPSAEFAAFDRSAGYVGVSVLLADGSRLTATLRLWTLKNGKSALLFEGERPREEPLDL